MPYADPAVARVKGQERRRRYRAAHPELVRAQGREAARRLRERAKTEPLIVQPYPSFIGRIRFASADGCWIWTGTTDARSGYGYLTIRGKTIKAHRFAHLLWIGPIPDGYEVDHLCFVRHCVNPRHLEAVTKAENLRRMNLHNGTGQTICRRCGANEWQSVNVRTGRKAGKPHRRCGACNRQAYHDKKVA